MLKNRKDFPNQMLSSLFLFITFASAILRSTNQSSSMLRSSSGIMLLEVRMKPDFYLSESSQTVK